MLSVELVHLSFLLCGWRTLDEPHVLGVLFLNLYIYVADVSCILQLCVDYCVDVSCILQLLCVDLNTRF